MLQDCGNGWTSMKGRVTFWYHLNFTTNEGFVQFKLYGQQCKKCNSGKFEYVMWYPEEVSKVMCNVYNKVGQTYYGFMQPPIRIDRRPGRPRNQHNSDLCQACRDGECDQARPFKSINGIIPNGVITPSPVTSPTSTAGPMVPLHPPPLMVPLPNGTCAQVLPRIQESVITVPVNLSSGAHPILTYSVVKAPPCITDINNNPVEFTSAAMPVNGTTDEPVDAATEEVIQGLADVSLSGKEVSTQEAA